MPPPSEPAAAGPATRTPHWEVSDLGRGFVVEAGRVEPVRTDRDRRHPWWVKGYCYVEFADGRPGRGGYRVYGTAEEAAEAAEFNPSGIAPANRCCAACGRPVQDGPRGVTTLAGERLHRGCLNDWQGPRETEGEADAN